MNNFRGRILSLDLVAIDKFTSRVLDCTAFFLSHKHTDHMEGLSSAEFHARLKSSEDIHLYCSKVTATLLRNDPTYSHLGSKIKVLPMQSSGMIEVPGTENLIQVTFLPSGHCPGSVMIHFETPDRKTILYTGDFRLDVSDLKRLDILHKPNGQVRHLSSLYLDTTFFTPTMADLPTREYAADKIVQLAKNWLNEGDDHVVSLHCAGHLGSEFLFVELHKKLGMKVHVSSQRYRMYRNVPDIEAHVTEDPDATRIHACKLEMSVPLQAKHHKVPVYLPCNAKQCFKVLAIRPVSMWFSDCVTKKGITHSNEDMTYVRVCYSMHASYNEILAFAQYLRPEHIHPIVVPLNESVEQVTEHLERIVHQSDSQDSSQESSQELNFSPVPKKRKAMLSAKKDVKWDFSFSPSPVKLKNSQSDCDDNESKTPSPCRNSVEKKVNDADLKKLPVKKRLDFLSKCDNNNSVTSDPVSSTPENDNNAPAESGNTKDGPELIDLTEEPLDDTPDLDEILGLTDNNAKQGVPVIDIS